MAASAEMTTIQIEGVIEGDRVDTTDYFFERIGESVPVKTPPFHFDLQNLPSQPLAVSDSHIFVALPSGGFCVARTEDVIALADEIEEKGSRSSIHEVSVVDVPLGEVRILALSSDNSTLAVSLAQDIHFFSVNSLLRHKGHKPSFSCSLNESSHVKDLQWRKRSENSYLVLSNSGQLYHGTNEDPIKDVMDNVDAVEWSINGNYVAVARNNILTILSSKFKERASVVLPFESLIGDSDVNSAVKVDSIRWIRPDVIILGYLQLTNDGREENYFVQVIKSKDGKISDVSFNLAMLTFFDMFSGIVDDILPFGSGPYLLSSYVEQCELVIAANKKNTDQHIVHIGCSLGEEKNEVAIVDILRDKWLPRIELQENDDENLILGLGISRVLCCGKLNVDLGDAEERELSPYCILLCLTLEGKVVMFKFASFCNVGDSLSSEAPSDACKGTAAVVPEESEQSKPFEGLEEEQLEHVSLPNQYREIEKKEPDINESNEFRIVTDPNPPDVTESSISMHVTTQISLKECDTSKEEAETPSESKTYEADEKQNFPFPKLHQEMNIRKELPSGKEHTKLEQSSTKASLPEGPHHMVKDFGKNAAHFFMGFRDNAVTSVGNLSVDAAGQSSSNDLQRNEEIVKESRGNTELTGLRGMPSQSISSRKFISSKDTDLQTSVISSNCSQHESSGNADLRAATSSIPGDFAGKLFQIKDTAAKSTLLNSSNRSLQNLGYRPVGTEIESLSSFHGSDKLSRENETFGEPAQHKLNSFKENFRSHHQSGMLHSEPILSKQFGNMNEMMKELDRLLQAIEEEGGFYDACTVRLKSSVEVLEQGIDTLSNKCQMWRSIMGEHMQEVQHLLDLTVQVLAKKICIEGIVKQASDNHYWDLWSCQKLNSELELKRRHVLNLNQSLKNCFIELERHFNVLEINKFGEDDRSHSHVGGRASQSRLRNSRPVWSFHNLHNTMISQLTAAEQLSECLSKQMEILKIESPSKKQQNVKRELFETIGIPYDPPFNSPEVTKFSDTFLDKELLLSGFAGARDHSRRKSSALKNFEQETSRRRRDSLDQAWASYDPPKATIKRMLVRETDKATVTSDKNFSPHLLKESMVADSLKAMINVPQVAQHPATPIAYGHPESPGLRELKFPTLQTNNMLSGSQLPLAARQEYLGYPRNMASEKLSSEITNIKKPDLVTAKETISSLNFGLSQKPSISPILPAQVPTLLRNPGGISNSGKLTAVSHLVKENVKDSHSTLSLFSESGKNVDPPSSHSAGFMVTRIQNPEVLQVDAESKSHPDKKVTLSPTFSMSPSASPSPPFNTSSISSSSALFSVSSAPASSPSFSSGAPKSFLAIPTSKSSTSFNSNIDANQSVSISSSSSSPSPTVLPFASFSYQLAKSPVPQSTPVPTMSLTSNSPKDVPQPSSKLDTNTSALSASVQPGDSIAESSMKLNPSLDCSQTVASSISSTFGSQLIVSSTESPPNMASNAQTVSSSIFQFPTQTPVLGGVGGGKTENLDVPSSQGSTIVTSGSQPSFTSSASSPSMMSNTQTGNAGNAPFQFPTQVPASGHENYEKTESLNVLSTLEDDMDEEAPETSNRTEFNMGNLGSFGLGSTPDPAPKHNPFGGPFNSAAINVSASPFNTTSPQGELFRPASFQFQSLQPSVPTQPANSNAFSGGFGTGRTVQAPAPSAFGQPAQIGAGQQALGSVLGSFGQSRQLGSGLPGSSFGSQNGYVSASSNSMGGFPNSATGGFAGVTSAVGGFARASAGGGFGAFGSQQTGGFPSFGSNTGGNGKPAELFTQIRK